jgi:hypothetical protein
LIPILMAVIFSVSFMSGREIVESEVRTLYFQPGRTLAMNTDEGQVDVRTWNQDSVRIVMIKKAWGRTERKARKSLENIRVTVSQSEEGVALEEKILNREELGVLDLFDPQTWQQGRWGGEQVNYEITLPVKSSIHVEQDKGNLTLTGTEGSLFIQLNEGNCRLDRIGYDRCSITLNEGTLNIGRMAGRDGSELYVKGGECCVQIDSLEGGQIELQMDEGWIRSKGMIVKGTDFRIGEGHMAVRLVPVSGGKYDFLAKEGDIDLRLSGTVLPDLTLQTHEGRISTDFDLQIQRSSEGERVYLKSQTAAGARLRIRVHEGDIHFDQDNQEPVPF